MYYNLLPEGLQAKSDNLGHAIRLLPGSVGYNTGKDLYRIKTRTAPFGRKLPGSQIEKGQNRRNFSRNRDRMCYHWPVGPSAGLSPAFLLAPRLVRGASANFGREAAFGHPWAVRRLSKGKPENHRAAIVFQRSKGPETWSVSGWPGERSDPASGPGYAGHMDSRREADCIHVSPPLMPFFFASHGTMRSG